MAGLNIPDSYLTDKLKRGYNKLDNAFKVQRGEAPVEYVPEQAGPAPIAAGVPISRDEAVNPQRAYTRLEAPAAPGQAMNAPVAAVATPAAVPAGMTPATAPTKLSMPVSTTPEPPAMVGHSQATPTTPPPMLGGARPNTGPVVPTQVGGPGGTMGVNLSENDRAIKESLAAIDNIVATSGIKVTPEQAEQIASLKQQAGFLRGGTDRVPVGPDGRPIRLGGASSPSARAAGSAYSFEGSPEAAQKFRTAVSPGEYSPEAQAARGKQREQFLTRQGFEKVDPATGLTPGQMNGLKPAERLGFAKMKSDAQAAKNTNAVAMMNATGQADERKVGLKVKQNELADQEEARALMAEMDTATPERQQQIDKKLVALGKKQPRAEKEPKVYFQKTYDEFGKVNGEEPFVYDESTGASKRLRVGGSSNAIPDLPKSTKDRKPNQTYKTANGEFMWDGTGLIKVK